MDKNSRIFVAGHSRPVTLQQAPDPPVPESSATIRTHLRFHSILPALCAEHLRLETKFHNHPSNESNAW